MMADSEFVSGIDRDNGTSDGDKSFLRVVGEMRDHVNVEVSRTRVRLYEPANDATLSQHAAAYVLSGEGKRMRAVLCLLAAQAVHQSWRSAIPAAVAIEMVHAYSLAHDDLPCMDNDDLRRGRPTAHKVFGENFALLAGDALLTDAFSCLCEGQTSPSVVANWVAELARAAGGSGMVAGQSLDLQLTGKIPATDIGNVQEEDSDLTIFRRQIERIHRLKTGYMFGAAAAMGALSQAMDARVVNAFREFGIRLGVSFQIIDDLLDETSNIGKTSGKDKAQGKATFATIERVDNDQQNRRSRILSFAEEHSVNALKCLDGLGIHTSSLEMFSRMLLTRTV